jgi:hypothetical protein
VEPLLDTCPPGLCGLTHGVRRGQVVDSGSKNMEVAIIKAGQPVRLLEEAALAALSAQIEAEAEEAKSKGVAEAKDN